MDFINRHVQIWLSEGSCAPVLVRSIEHSEDELHHRNAHIWLSMNSECNYNYDHHVFVKSLVSPHGSGSSNEERVKRKRKNVISPDGDGRSMKSRRESFASHNSDGWRAKSKRVKGKAIYLLIPMMMEGEWRGKGESGRVRARALCFIVPMKGELREKSKALYLFINSDGRGMERRRRERERSQSEREMTMTMRGDTGEKGRN
nr:hypothetical protein [Tanacetum cinerariifolium]